MTQSGSVPVPASPPAALPLIVSAGEALTDLVTARTVLEDREVELNGWHSHPGGAGWNVARACAALGAASAFAGAVGQDNFGDELWAASQAAGLDLRFMQRAEQPTLLAVVYSAHPPAYRFMGENSADLAFDASQLPEGWMKAARWLHVGGISLARPPLAARLVELAQQARVQGVKISFDPNARISHRDPAYRPVMEAVIRQADLIKFSDEDLRFFFPEHFVAAPDEAACLRVLRGLNAKAPIVVTRGGDGATLYHSAGAVSLPAPRVNVADTVGAGDALCAGMLVSASERPEAIWTEHLRFALAVASAACSRPGAYAPTREDAAPYLEQTHPSRK